MSTEETLSIDGPAGTIEASLSFNHPDCKQVAIVCHPHPLYGGNMHDSVVGSIKAALLQKDIACLRFNFRGVGASEGVHDKGVGETADVIFLPDWLRREKYFDTFFLGGYSFGAIISLQAAQQSKHKIEHLLLVAPPIDMADTPEASAVDCPVTILAGSLDNIAPVSSIDTWIKAGAEQHKLIELDGADHFFASDLENISELLVSELRVS